MNASTPSRTYLQRGLSLIELLVALLIGSFLMLGLVQVMSASRAAYQLAEGVGRAQENARFAMDFLQRDLRMTGHMGCVNDQARLLSEGVDLLFLNAADRAAGAYQNAPYALRFDIGLQGFEAAGTGPGNTLNIPAGNPTVGNANSWQPAIPATLWNALTAAGSGPIAGSDIMVMRYFSPIGAQMSGMTLGNPSLVAVNNTEFDRDVTVGGDGLFGLADCLQASVFAGVIDAGTGQVSVASGAGLNQSNFDGGSVFSDGQAMVHRAEVVVYYVGIGANPEQPALFRAHFIRNATGGLDTVREELVEGVESLQLLYGLDSKTAPGERPSGFIASSEVASGIGSGVSNPSGNDADAWRRVGLVQIGLLMRSSERAAAEQADDNPSVLNVQMNTGNDGYYRSVYENTVALRNRLFGN
jgi:type IV pilus assembly protein PilW